MLKKDGEMLHAYYYGISKMRIIWNDDLKKMDQDNKIQKIYEVIDSEFNETWYYIKDIKENGYIVKNRLGREFGSKIMNKYKIKYPFNRIGTEIMKLIDDGIFPIVVKVKKEKFNIYYDSSKNINNFFFNNYYCESDDKFIAVKSFRNKVEYLEFNDEILAIRWCGTLDYRIKYIPDNELLKSIYIDIN